MLQILMSGLAMGCIYALIALALAMIYNSVGVVNFAQGDLVMLGTFVTFAALVQAKLPYWLALLAVLLVMGLLGLLFHFTAYRPLQNKPVLTVIIATISLGIVLRNVALFIWGSMPLTVPTFVSPEPVRWLGASIPRQSLFIIAAAVVILALQYLFMTRTRLGRQMRATAQDPTAARLMGIPANLIIAGTFAYSTALAGFAGVLVGPAFLATTDIGGLLGLKAFTATVLGGFGREEGAVVGGILVGLAEVILGVTISSQYRDAMVYCLLFAVLLVRPRGLFGEAIGEKV